MKKLSKLLFITLLFTVGLISVNAAPFKIGEVEYDSLKDAVAAAPTDGTKTTIVMTEDVTGGSGVIVQAGKNLVIDFGGHRYETEAPMVGSTGTETQSFQLLKGSTVHMKNGTLIPSTRSDSIMFIQNYCDLTVEDITIDGSTNPNAGFYAISNNNGKVNIIGNTSIKVNPDIPSARAFDMCWAPLIGTGTPYNGGTQIVVDTTGKIEGMIELDVWGTFSDANGIKSTLTIKNMNFEGTWSIDSRLAGQLSIEGGTFKKTNTIDLDEYVTGNNNVYTEDNETYKVLPSATVEFNEENIFILKGKTYTLTPKKITEGYEKYLGLGITDKNIATLNNGVITGVEVGNTTLNYSLGRLGGSIDITVFEVKAAESEDTTEEEINEDATDVTLTLIEKALTEDTVEGMDNETVENLKAAVLAGKTVETNVAIEEVKKDDVEKEVVEQIEKIAKEANAVVAGYLNIDILLQASGDELGKVTKLPESIKVTVDVDTSLGNVPKDTTRSYYIVRLHEDEEPEIIEAKYKDGKLSFETDRFSQYAYGYTDTKEEAASTETEAENTNIPKTGDSIALYLTLFVMSSLGIVGTILLNKKRLVSIKK